jgi:hypothetical protein
MECNMQGILTFQVSIDIGNDEFWEDVTRAETIDLNMVSEEIQDALENRGFEVKVKFSEANLRN